MLTILVSVWDKTGLVPFLNSLKEKTELRLLATGSTCQSLKDSGFACENVSDITEFPEILDGRVKTLHPKIFGGILAKETPEHQQTLATHHIPNIDMVIVNLYPFQAKLKENLSPEAMIEFIDIGGVALIRAAAKNHTRVAVLCSERDYTLVLNSLDANGKTNEETRRELAGLAFQHTTAYDSAIANYFTELSANTENSSFPETIQLSLNKVQDLRYGENPHCAGAWYNLSASDELPFTCLQGKELSYNNLLDVAAAYHLIREFKSDDGPACCIIKHGNPCGVAVSDNITNAYTRAFEADSISAFGGIIALNRPATKELAEEINQQFAELVIAPSFDSEAQALFATKKNLRLIEFPRFDGQPETDVRFRDLSPIGFLLEKPDLEKGDENNVEFEVVTKTPIPNRLVQQTHFAWSIVKHLRSNAVVVANDGVTLGLGMGQTSRIASTLIALEQAGKKAEGAILASDGFFPATDNIEAMAKAGISVVIQPGGSIKDADVIAAADQCGIAMVFTHQRCFKH